MCIEDEEETFEHLFPWCDFAKCCWNLIGLGYPPDCSLQVAIELFKTQLRSPFFVNAHHHRAIGNAAKFSHYWKMELPCQYGLYQQKNYVLSCVVWTTTDKKKIVQPLKEGLHTDREIAFL